MSNEKEEIERLLLVATTRLVDKEIAVIVNSSPS